MPTITRHFSFDTCQLQDSEDGYPAIVDRHFAVHVRARVPSGASLDDVLAATTLIEKTIGAWIRGKWSQVLFVAPDEQDLAFRLVNLDDKQILRMTFVDEQVGPQNICDTLLHNACCPVLRQPGLTVDMVEARQFAQPWYRACLQDSTQICATEGQAIAS